MLEDVLDALAGGARARRHHGGDDRPGGARSGAALRRADIPTARATRATPARSSARRAASPHAAQAMLTIPGDVPLVTAAEIERVIAAHRRGHRLRHRAGARRAGLQCDPVPPRRCGAAALRRGQLLPASRGGAGLRHRAGDRCACPASGSISTRPRISPHFSRGRRAPARGRCLLDTRLGGARGHDPSRRSCTRRSRRALSDDALALADCDDLAALMARAAALRDDGHGRSSPIRARCSSR